MNGEKFVFNNITNNYYQIATSDIIGHNSPAGKNDTLYAQKQCGG